MNMIMVYRIVNIIFIVFMENFLKFGIEEFLVMVIFFEFLVGKFLMLFILYV